jgi:hypothetical protein
MKIATAIFVAFTLFLGFVITPAEAHPKTYSQILCKQSLFYCYQVKKADTWEKLFPGWNERNIAKRLNRMNSPLQAGMVIAIPKEMTGKTAEDFSPFPKFLPWVTEKTVIFSLNHLYFAAYDAHGHRVITGPIAAGANCPATKGGCWTPTGSFRFYQKYGPNAVSSLYPVHTWKTVIKDGKKKRVPDKRGGAKIPWFMAIVDNVGFHGFKEIPGYNASRGCIRGFTDDAQWLNQRFVEGTPQRPGTLALIMKGLPSPNAPPPLEDL